MSTAQVALRDLLREHVAPTLRERRFAGSAQDFHRRIDGNWAAINVQRDRYSTAEEVRFTVNLGTASTAVRTEDGFSPDEPAREIDCHWRTRIGDLLLKPADAWWSVRSDAPASRIVALGNTVAGHLADRAVPKLEVMASDEAILATVLDGEPRAGLEPADMDMVGPILRRLGPPGRFARWLDVLDEPAEGEAALAVYTLFDDYPPARMGARRIEQRLEKLDARGLEPRQQAIIDLGFAQRSDRIIGAIRPALDDGDWRIRFAAAQALGRLGDTQSAPRLAEMVRAEPVRFTAVHAAFALVRLDRSLDAAGRPETRAALADRRDRAVGHDRAALSHLIRSLDSPA
jgi:Domain of unknown function (DUF4304)/HEAT repeats